MTIKIDATVQGAHVHVIVYAGKDMNHLALTGKLVFRPAEWDEFKSHFKEFDTPHCKCEAWYCGHSRDCPEWKEGQ